MSASRTGRILVYPAEVLANTDLLNQECFRMADVSCLAQAVLGYGVSDATLVSGLACTATAPQSFSVDIAPGTIYSLENYDATAYPSDNSGLPVDTTQNLYKQGINLDKFNVMGLTAPVSGTLYYLIQARWATSDVDPTSRQYYNPATPQTPITAVADSVRKDYVFISAKSSPSSTPAPDAGFVGLWAVTVPSGSPSIDSGMIALYSGAPFISETLTQKISQTTGDARYTQISNYQKGNYIYGTDSGAANAYVLTLTPALSGAYVTGTYFRALITNSNTGASTMNVNGLGALAVNKVTATGLFPLTGGELIAGTAYEFLYNGAVFELLNASNSTPYSSSVFNISNTQSLTANTPTLLVWDTVEYADSYGVITFTGTPTYKMTANIAGLYEISTIVEFFSGTLDTKFILSMYLNGGLYQVLQSGFIRSTTVSQTFNGTTKLYLTPSNIIQIFGESRTNSGTIGAGSASNVFQMTYLGN